MTDTTNTITPYDVRRDELASQVIDLIVYKGKTVSAAVKEVGVPRSTWYYWLSSGKIHHLLVQLQADVREQTRQRFRR